LRAVSHADFETVLGQLQAAAPYPVSAIVRPASNDPVLIKRFLDIGAQSLLIPYVQTAQEAKAAVAATRYAPEGVRGVAALTRATRFGRVKGYAAAAAKEICTLVQIETVEGLGALEDIAAVEGVDGIFIGPGDLSATLGYVDNIAHPDVVAAVELGIQRIRAAGKPAGLLTSDVKWARRCVSLGCVFTAVGSDIGVLARGTEALLRTTQEPILLEA
jgi:4-hydroxy-2-oxoheptanedioate aldolase